jgi:hypothetical protein
MPEYQIIGGIQMNTINEIPSAVAAIIPKFQLIVTMENLEAYSEAIERLGTALKKCPKIGETDGMVEHPAILHYFYGGNDHFICEYDPDKGLMFGYAILGGDLENSEWGYISVEELVNCKYTNIDYHFEEQSIEAALYKAYPKYFKKPSSLRQEFSDKLAEQFHKTTVFPISKNIEFVMFSS